VPHHTLRENPLAAGAGADRLSTGMKHSFGKTIGTACQVHKGKVIFELFLPAGEEIFGREALRVGSSKLTLRTTTHSTIQKVKKLTKAELETNAEIDRKEAEQKAAAAAAAAAKAELKAETKTE
jgi:ribosomal protein L16/L10AE